MVPSTQNIRMTEPRKVILEELRRVDTHPTADKVYEIVRRRLPRVSLATVYRNLEWLAQTGLIQKYESAGSQRRYDGNPHSHDHIRCVACGRLDDLVADPLAAVEQRISGKTDYQIVGYRLEYLGICPSCQASSARRMSRDDDDELDTPPAGRTSPAPGFRSTIRTPRGSAPTEEDKHDQREDAGATQQGDQTRV